jgi:hypothetical protein
LRQLRLPIRRREFEKPTRDAAVSNQPFIQFLFRFTELKLPTRAANVVTSRIKNAGFLFEKDFDTCDFGAMPQLFQPEDPGAGALRMDRAEIELLFREELRNWEDSHVDWARARSVSSRSTGALLHGGGRTGQPLGERTAVATSTGRGVETNVAVKMPNACGNFVGAKCYTSRLSIARTLPPKLATHVLRERAASKRSSCLRLFSI